VLTIRDEQSRDRAAVFALEAAAFGRPEEARLVDALRESVTPRLSLVAERDGRLVGHAFFSPVSIEGPRPGPPAGALGPIGVDPARQKQGIGSALVRAGLARAPALDWCAIFLLGSPDYYARFGFRLAAARGLHYESSAFDAGFQVLELEPDALQGVSGFVRYPSAFANV
jgi:putative acetyltransferase